MSVGDLFEWANTVFGKRIESPFAETVRIDLSGPVITSKTICSIPCIINEFDNCSYKINNRLPCLDYSMS